MTIQDCIHYEQWVPNTLGKSIETPVIYFRRVPVDHFLISDEPIDNKSNIILIMRFYYFYN